MKSTSRDRIVKIIFLNLAFVFYLFACVTEQASVISKEEKAIKTPGISNQKYLTATGIGATEKEARLGAKAELSAIFESRVESDVINRVRSVVEASGKETVTRDDERNIKVLSSVDLSGVEIGKTWYDEKQRAYYALATLDRGKAGEEWQKEIDRFDDDIELIIQSLNSKKSDFSRFQSLKKAKQLWLNKEVTLSRLRVIGYSDTSTATYEIKDILKNIEKLKSQFLIAITLKGANNGLGQIISDEVAQYLSREGYLMTEEVSKANIIVGASLTVDPVELNNPDWKFARATLNLSIVDKATGLTVGEISENKRASHLTYKEAAHKAVKAVANMSAQMIIDYFGSSN